MWRRSSSRSRHDVPGDPAPPRSAPDPAHVPVPEVSRSGYHAWAWRVPSARAWGNQRLLERIREIHIESNGVIGMPRMREHLAFEGGQASRDWVAQLMGSADPSGVQPRRRRHKRVGWAFGPAVSGITRSGSLRRSSRIPNGPPTSPTSVPPKAGCSCAWCSTCAAGRSWAGR